MRVRSVLPSRLRWWPPRFWSSTGTACARSARTPRPAAAQPTVARPGGFRFGGAPRPSAAVEPEFAALYLRTAEPLTRLAYLLTGNARRARGSTLRAFRQALRHWSELAVDPTPQTWLRAAVADQALSSWWFRLPRPTWRTLLVLSGSAAPSAGRATVAALRGMPLARRRTLVLREFAGLPLAQVAAEMEASVPTTEGWLSAGRATLARAVPGGRGTAADGPTSPAWPHQLLTEAAGRFQPRLPGPTAAWWPNLARARVPSWSAGGAAVLAAVWAGWASAARLRHPR